MLSLQRKVQIITVCISAVVMLLLDFVYLSTSSSIFGKVVKQIQSSPLKLRMSGAVLCYLALIFAINYFVLLNDKLTFHQKLQNGFLLGLVIYAVFETTNYAIFKDWTIPAVLIDSFWGAILFFVTTYLTLVIVKKLKKLMVKK